MTAPDSADDPHRPERRDALQSMAALALAGTTASAAAAAGPLPPTPGAAMTATLPPQRRPGRPGDFAFLDGEWTIRHLRRLPDGAWDAFDGEARCFGILGGVGSVEELRIPARKFSGMGLRLLDATQHVWVDHWVNAAAGVLTLPGLNGSFENGAGIFEADDEADGQRVTYRSVWDLITERSCRWQQGESRDGGRTWSLSWSMDWTRLR